MSVSGSALQGILRRNMRWVSAESGMENIGWVSSRTLWNERKTGCMIVMSRDA